MRRRILASAGGTSGGDLPPGYRKVLYIQRTYSGPELIDTGILTTLKTRIVVDIQIWERAWQYVNGFGIARTAYAGGTRYFAVGLGVSGGGSIAFSGIVDGEYKQFEYGVDYITTRPVYKISFGNGPTTVEANGSVIYDGPELSFVPEGGELDLIRANSLRLYGCDVMEDGVLIANLVPCVREDDGRAGVYDTVRDLFLTNETGTNFTYGELDVASNALSAEGGGTECLTPRRSYRRSSRPSARFCAHSQEWEVAA